MHRLQSDSGSSDDNDSMNNPPAMRSTVSSSKGCLEELPEILADDVNSVRDEFTKLYDKDYPQLQRCLEKLRNIILTFERDFRSATKGARDGGAVGIAGGVGLIAGLALAPFTGGLSLAVAGVGAGAATGGGIYGGRSCSEKERKMTQLKQDIEAELMEFQNIINPMSEKMKDINERIKGILKELDKLEIEARDVSEYFASASERRNMLRDDMNRLNAQMSIIMDLIGTIAAIFPGIWLLLDFLGVLENTRALDDMDYLAKRPIDEQIDESKMTSKAGKFIVRMRKIIYELQNIMGEIKKTKYTMEHLRSSISNSYFK